MKSLFNTTHYIGNSIKLMNQQVQNNSGNDSSLNRVQIEEQPKLTNISIEENAFGVLEIQNAIPQYGNSCWFNSCLNMLAMVPSFTTNNQKINDLLNRIRGNNNLSYREIMLRISFILEQFNKSRFQFETSDGMEILLLTQISKNVVIMVYEIPDEFKMTKFLIIPTGVIHSFGCGFQDILTMKGSKSTHDYQPVAWIIRRGDLDFGHCTLIYQNDNGELFEINSVPQTIRELRDFPVLTETDTIQYILYAKLV